MDSIEAIKTAFRGAHMWFEGTAGDVSAAQANQAPPGKASSIGELIAHILHCEDGMLSMFLLNQQPLWEREGWGSRLGGPMLIDMPAERSQPYNCDPAQMREYAKAVFAQTDACLANLKQADLDRELDMTEAGLGKMPVGQFLLTMLLGNTYAHTGEISTLKGLVGAKGYPF